MGRVQSSTFAAPLSDMGWNCYPSKKLYGQREISDIVTTESEENTKNSCNGPVAKDTCNCCPFPLVGCTEKS